MNILHEQCYFFYYHELMSVHHAYEHINDNKKMQHSFNCVMPDSIWLYYILIERLVYHKKKILQFYEIKFDDIWVKQDPSMRDSYKNLIIES